MAEEAKGNASENWKVYFCDDRFMLIIFSTEDEAKAEYAAATTAHAKILYHGDTVIKKNGLNSLTKKMA